MAVLIELPIIKIVLPMKKVFFSLLIIISATSAKSQDINEQSLLDAMHSITSEELFEYVKIQCDDKYQGRLTGTPEYQACAEWLADNFKEWGLTPAGDNGTWFQWYAIPYTLI